MDEILNKYRVFPRLMMSFHMYMFWEFHQWFTNYGNIKVTDLTEWQLVQYSAVLAAFVGFAKFYMDTPRK